MNKLFLTSSDYDKNWVKEKLEIVFDEQQKEKIKTIMAKEELDNFALGIDTSFPIIDFNGQLDKEAKYVFTENELKTLKELFRVFHNEFYNWFPYYDLHNLEKKIKNMLEDK